LLDLLDPLGLAALLLDLLALLDLLGLLDLPALLVWAVAPGC
jgi:hypothetical protein